MNLATHDPYGECLFKALSKGFHSYDPFICWF